MSGLASTLARIAAATLILMATGPSPALAQGEAATSAARSECVPTAMAIRQVSSGEVGLEFLPLAATSEGSTLEGTVGDLRGWIPSLSEGAANEFAAHMMRGDDGVYSLTCDWAALGVAERRPSNVQEWLDRLRIAHPLVTADGQEALVFIAHSGDDPSNSWVKACYLTGGPSAWVVQVCREVDY